MTDKETLSDKIWFCTQEDNEVIHIKDVKEFIKKLKEFCKEREKMGIGRISGYMVNEEIDKLAGDKLT